tara:strand:- start:137 stop:2047 length:1911 start_codon:yes stop_codon:yes gene_type:complete
MKWIGQHIYDQVSKFRNTVDFSKDVTFYQPVNNANPTISIGSSDDERLRIFVNYQGTTTQSAQIATFVTHTESGTANDGRFQFWPDGVKVLSIDDGGIDFEAGFGISIDGTDILTDSSGTATLSNIDALDATTIATFNAALTAGDITGVTAGTGLSGGGTSGAVTLNVDAAQTQITSVGTIGTGVWNGTAITAAYIAAAQTNITSLGALTALVVDDVTINGSGITSDTADLTITASADLNLVAMGNDITVDTDNFVITSSTSQTPFLELKNTTNNIKGSVLQFTKDKGAAGADGDTIGRIVFMGDDAVQAQTPFASIACQISEADDSDEAGKLILSVAASDGTTVSLRAGLLLEGEHATSGEVDVTIAAGAASTTTIAGTLTMGSTATIDNSGVWVGGVIPSAKLDADTAHLSGTQTFTGTKTLNSFKGTGGATVTNILDEDAMGSDSATALATQQSIKAYVDNTHTTAQTGKNYRIINASFRDDIATTKHYVPMKSAEENISLTRAEQVGELAVCDGRLVSATVRLENMQTEIGAFNLTMGVETNVINTSYTGFSVIETEVLEVTDTNDDHHVFHFVFDDAKHWDSTDMFAISIESSGDAWGSNERFFVTLVIEDDWSTYLGIANTSSVEIETTP